MKIAAKDFKMTELGPIPKNWEVKRLGELLEFKNGYNTDASNFGKGVPFASVLDALSDRPATSKSILGRVVATRKAEDEFSLTYGDLIFTRSSETLEDVGRSNVYVDRCQGAIFGGFVIRGRPIFKFDSVFLNYLLKDGAHRIRVYSQGAGAQHYNIGQTGLGRVNVTLPPFPEQRKIAAALSDVDEMIVALEKLIEKKRKIKTGAMQRLLIGKTRLPGFKGAWVEKRFEDVFVHVPSKTYQIAAEEYLSGGLFPVVDQGQSTVVGFSNRKDKVFRVNEEGVIVFGDHTRIIKYVDFDFVVGADGTQLLLGNSTIADTRFLSYCLERLDIPNLGYSRHFKYVKDGVYAVPPTLAEQKAIAKVLGDIDEEIAALEAELAKTRLLKQGMMQELLTGKVRLSRAVTPVVE